MPFFRQQSIAVVNPLCKSDTEGFIIKAKAIFCWGLYIFNGGLGFIYFIDYANNGGYTLSDIFTGYYTTPTNLVEHNIRWVNIIADILLPQRASVFGYAMAICALWLLYSAVWKGKKEYFTLAGIFAASLPLIHTHSFLAVVLISAAWLLLYLYRNTVNCKKWFGGHILMVFVLFMCIIQFYVTGEEQQGGCSGNCSSCGGCH